MKSAANADKENLLATCSKY